MSKEAVSQRKRERDDGMGRLRVDHPRGYKTASGEELELGGGGDTLSKIHCLVLTPPAQSGCACGQPWPERW